MSIKTSISLDPHFQAFIEGQVATGRYATASEVVRDALRRMEEEAAAQKWLFDRLDKSLASGISPHSAEEIFAEAKAIARGEKKLPAR
jgi:antitoxin ParD1/3/4